MNLLNSTQKHIEKTTKSITKAINLKSYRKLAINFLILTINLAIIILYFTLSKATITIIPVKETFANTIEIPILEKSNNIESEIFVLGSIAEAYVEHEKIFEINETKEIKGIARGTITIINTTNNRNQTFVRNTRFQNENRDEIKTDQQIIVGPGQRITIPAYASEEGREGNFGKDSGKFQVVALPYLKDQIYAEIEEPFKGGVKTVKILTEKYFEESKKAIENELMEKAWEKLKESHGENINKNEISLEKLEFETISNPGDLEKDSFTIKAKATAYIFVFDQTRAKEITKQELIKKTPIDKIVVDFIEDSYKIENDLENLKIVTSITARTHPKIPEIILKQEDIIGMNKNEVKEYFQRISGIREVDIKFWPFWVRSVPNLKDHVDIEIQI